MADLLPSSRDTSAADETDPRVIGLDSEAADELLDAISAGTARKLLAALHEEPATASEVADAADTSLQNAQYHLGKLEDAGIIEIADTCYSEKGREMKVFAPADRPLVVFAGREEHTTGLKAALRRLLGGLGILGLASLAVQSILGGTNVGAPTADGDESVEAQSGGDDAAVAGDTPTPGDDDVSIASDGNATGTPSAEETGTPIPDAGDATGMADTATETAATATRAAAETAGPGGVPPGVLFFVGGAVVLLAVTVIWYHRSG